VEIMPGKEGMVYVSHLKNPPVRRPEEAVKVGDEIKVRAIEVDQQGRINLSAINLDQPFDASMSKRPDAPAPQAAPDEPEDDETPKARFRPRR
jgi:predicted RNA-binding protein with RPS1 domain